MTELTATVRNAHGIHVRPSTCIVTEVLAYPGEVRAQAATGEADLRSVLSLLALTLEPGAKVKIRVTGPDEQAVCQRLVELFEKEYDFPPAEA